jgi:LysM repeat protein
LSYGRIPLSYQPSEGGDGAEIIYALRNTDALSKRIAKEFENNGQNVRKYYQRRLPSNPAKDYYYMLRDTPNNESLIVEYGFVDSTGDDVSLLKNDWQELAEAVIKALVEYSGKTYTPVSGNYYKVQSGDSLWSIAKKYNTTVTKLKERNNLTSNLLSVGQILYLPTEEESTPTSTNTYVVKSGDTLYSIANKNNTTVDELKTLNNLSSNTLSIGQVLKLPVTTITYTVVKGDTLYSIAQKYNTTVSSIETLNNLSTSNLSIGQKLIIKS